jgi:hypothetical protein
LELTPKLKEEEAKVKRLEAELAAKDLSHAGADDANLELTHKLEEEKAKELGNKVSYVIKEYILLNLLFLF